MINFCIVEDDPEMASGLAAFIKSYTGESGIDIEQSAERFLENNLQSYDVIFMDIDLPDLNGMEAVRAYRNAGGEGIVIFVTNLAQFAVGGYEVGAFDFIVKPVSYHNFAMKLKRALNAVNMRRGKEIWVATRQGKRLIDAKKLVYIEVMKHQLTYHTFTENIVGSGTLKSALEALEGLPFALCNRCYLVNLACITEVSGNYVTVGGDKLLISSPKKKEFLKRFNEYLGAGGRGV